MVPLDHRKGPLCTLISGTNSGPELLLELDRAARRPLRAQLEDGLREAVRSGRLPADTRGCRRRARWRATSASRGGWSSTPTRSCSPRATCSPGGAPARTWPTAAEAERGARRGPRAEARPTFDFFPGYPDLASFPRGAWLRALREVLREAPDRDLGYPDPRGAPELRARARRAPAPGAGRGRRPRVDRRSARAPRRASRCSRARSARRAWRVEDPGLPAHRAILARARRDARGARRSTSTARVCTSSPRSAPAADRRGAGHARAPVAHRRRARARAPRRAARRGPARPAALVVEDDYDAEYRYDRAPLAAMQGLAPDRVVYLGTVSKTLAPALRLGWLVLPARLLDGVVDAEGADGPRLPDARSARARPADRERRLRPPPARGAAALPRAPRRARAGRSRGICRVRA